MVTYQEVAAMIDHAVLKANLTDEEIKAGCHLADTYGVAAVCVRPADVKMAVQVLQDSITAVAAVIGFPHGSTTPLTKLAESREALENGARELDVVLNIGKLKSGAYDYVREELKEIVDLAHQEKALVKIIFENCYLSDQEKITACRIVNEIGADFAKTSTGFGSGGAVENDVMLMRAHCQPEVGIKASGGIKTLADAIRYKELGCSRLGCSQTAEILNALKK
ncbi:deoxyribose-phosphate aldolase [Dehalobacterium formicoaceticum]|uniref:Deoxyribose-phosphate aldolase n=1 Tax=Dehalobacterium formicoaceticum TaxID=51515 RepID=A0ABT1Y070_9FIRM|nr:deoxyribose-phosphate aldolase [Dehalobacterium formicoaceticum]MCR6544273.1 deoxyribose-phosphate aldolase [Dehalobacterium formicoaceticum]